MQIKNLCNRYSRAAMHQQLPAGIHHRAGNRFMAKTVRIMKLTALMIFLLGLQVHAKVASQKITFTGKNVTLEKAFAEIKAQTGYLVIGNKKMLDNASRITISARQMPLKQFLELLLKNQELQFSIEEQTIIVAPKAKTPAASTTTYTTAVFAAPPPPVQIVGYLYRQDGKDVLVGATVQLKGAKTGVSSDNQGRFSIEANVGDMLVISYVGFETKVVEVKSPNMGVIYLAASQNQLDETVVMAYGTTTRRFSTGNIARVTADDIAKQPVTNPLLALQNRMPGVLVTQNSGVTGAKVTIQVRGQNFLQDNTSVGRNDPLYIIDGIPFPGTALNKRLSGVNAGDGATGETSPLNAINPTDIESIEVLKDADATAIYGSRAANGVILITTKKGKSGKTTFNANVYTGRANNTRSLEMLSTEDYRYIRRISFANAGVTPTAANAPELLVWDSTQSTNFQKLLTNGTMHTTDANVSVSGGDIKNKLLLSASYHKENTVFASDQGYSRASVLLNSDHTSLDGKFNVTASVQYSSDKNNLSAGDPTSSAYTLPPNYHLYNSDGSLYWFGTISNPMAQFNRRFRDNNSNLNGHALIRYSILPGLDIKTSLGYNKLMKDQVGLYAASQYNPSYNITSGTASFSNFYAESYIIEPQATYSRVIGQGRLNVLAGGTWQATNSKNPYSMTASGYTSDDFLEDPQAASSRSVSTSSSQYRYVSLFGRATYNLKSRYILNATFRRDGSSRFGPGKRFGNFGAVGAAWLFSEESFAKNIPGLSFGKLRGSYGVAGNDQIPDYQYASFYGTTTTYGTATTLVPSGLSNPNIKWEVTRKLEGAIDLGFLKERILFSAAWFRNRSNDQLISYTLTPQTGFSSYTANMPALVQNNGWEFTLSTVNINKGKFRYTTALNITIPQNKLIYYPDLNSAAATYYVARYAAGYPLSSVFLYHYIGDNATTGLPMVEDVDKSGSVTNGISYNNKGDKIYVGNTYPKFYGGLNNSFSYKGFQLDVFLQFNKQKSRNLSSLLYYPPGNALNSNMPKAYVYRYLGSRDKWANNPKISQQYTAAYTAYSNWAASDANFVDASFIRVKNINFSYTLPAGIVKKWHLQNVRVYMQAQNLFTITGYKEGFDPENASSAALPPLRIMTGGIQLTL